MDNVMNFLNNKKIKDAFYTWKFKTEKKKFDSKLKEHYNLKRCFRKWLKLKNKRRIIDDLINKKKNALTEKFVNTSQNIDNILLKKSKEYFLGRLIKNINNQLVCDMIDNAYINNYKRIFLNKLAKIPNLFKGFNKLLKTLNDKIKKDAIKKIKKKLRVDKFGKELKNILIKKLKEKFLSKIDFNKDYDDKNLDKKEIDIIKSGKKLKRIMDKNLKRYVFNKLMNYFKKYKKYDTLIKSTGKIFKKKFMENFKDKLEKINALNKIQKIMDNKKLEDFINKLKDISNSPEGKNNQKLVRCIKLKIKLQKLLLDKVLKDAFNEIKKKYNIVIGKNKLNKLMNTRYKKRFLYLIHLIYMFNKPKTSKIKSRYPLFNMTDLSAKIEQLLLKKIKQKFIDDLKNIKKIDKQLHYMFLTLNNKVKEDIFNIIKTLDFVNKLEKIFNKKYLLNKKEFLEKLKNERDINKKNEEEIKKEKDKKNEDNLKLKNYSDLWKKKVDLNNIRNKLIDKKKLKDKENKELLEKYFNNWKENKDKKNILSNLKNLKNEEIKDKNNSTLRKNLNKLNDKSTRRKILNDLSKLSKLKNILKNNDKNILSKSFNTWKNNAKSLKIKTISNLKLTPQKIYNTQYTPRKQKRPEFSIIKQNIISINDKNPNSDYKKNKKNDKPVKKDRSIKKRKIKRNKSKSRPKSKQNKYEKIRETLQKHFKKWKNNIQKMKIKDDFQHVINKIKDFNEKYGIKDDNMPSLNEEILQKLKKATVYLLLDIYKKNHDLILKKYFNKWKKKIKNNKEKNEEEPRNKYIKKKLPLEHKIKEINKDKYKEIDNNKYLIKLRTKEDKIFTKKKTKLNLYKERIDLYNSLSSRTSHNNIHTPTDTNYYMSNPESTYNSNKSRYMPYYQSENTLNEIPEKEYISKSIEKRRPKRNLMNIKVYDYDNNKEENNDENENEDTDEKYHHLDYSENTYPYDRKNETEEKNNAVNMINLDKTFSSKDYSTNNHFTLIEEFNEVRKPANYTNKPVYEKKHIKNKNKKIKNLLFPFFQNINLSVNLDQNNNLLTDRTSRNYNKSRNVITNINDSNEPEYSYISKSQQHRKRDKLNTFNVSIPVNNNKTINNEYESDMDYKNLDTENNRLKYSELKTDKITPIKEYNNNYTNEDINNKNKKGIINLKTPFRKYGVNWEKGNSTCPRIIKKDIDNNNYLNEENKGKKIKRTRHDKCKSGLDYLNGNNGYYLNDNMYDNNNYMNMKYDSSRKKLFI